MAASLATGKASFSDWAGMDAAQRQRIVALSAQDRLMLGCHMGDEEVCLAAIHAGADLNFSGDVLDIDDLDAVGLGGYTPLLCAILPYRRKRTGHLHIVNLLLAAGADPGDSDPKEYSPLVHAAAQGHTSIVSALIAAGACYDDAVPLILAAQHGHIDVVNVFLEKGARANVHQNDGKTPLLSATLHGRLRLLPLLLRRGAHARAGLNLYSQPGWDDDDPHAREVCEREWQRRCAIKTFGWDEQEIEGSYGRYWRHGFGLEKHKARRCWAYLEKIRAAGSFANYERAERERLMRLLDLRLGKRLPDEVLVVIVQCSKTPGDP